MNMKKMKIVSGLMAMAMTAMSLGVTAFAADSVDVKIGKVDAENGKFSVDVDLSSLPSTGLSSIDFAISYESGLKITDVSAGTAKSGAADQEGELADTLFTWKDTGKQIVLVWATGLTDSKYWVKEGTFVTISGTVDKEGTFALKGEAVSREAYPGGSANDAIVFSAVTDSGSTDYVASFSNGEVRNETETTKATETDAPKNVKYGDANCDKKITVGDAVLLARVAAEDKTANISSEGKTNGDVDNNGKITTDDVTMILKFLAGMIEEREVRRCKLR
jgi:hypothetical protein